MTPIAMGAPLRSLLTRCGQRLPWLKTALARLEAFSIRARISCDGPSLSVRQRDLARASAAAERCRAEADMRSATTRFRLSRSRRQSRYQEQSRWLTETFKAFAATEAPVGRLRGVAHLCCRDPKGAGPPTTVRVCDAGPALCVAAAARTQLVSTMPWMDAAHGGGGGRLGVRTSPLWSGLGRCENARQHLWRAIGSESRRRGEVSDTRSNSLILPQ